MDKIKKAMINIQKSYIMNTVKSKKQCDVCCSSIVPGTEYCPYCYSNIYSQIVKQISEENPAVFDLTKNYSEGN